MLGARQGALDTSFGVSFCPHDMGCCCILQMNMLPLQLQVWLVSGVREENEAGRAGLNARVRT